MRVAVFDLDGTLADTAEDLLAAANVALEQGGRDARLFAGRDSATAFAGGRAMLREGLGRDGAAWDEAEVDRLYPVLLEAYGAAIDTHTRLYDGAEEALDRIARAGWGLRGLHEQAGGAGRDAFDAARDPVALFGHVGRGQPRVPQTRPAPSDRDHPAGGRRAGAGGAGG